jgi:small subunit ribosomal protein S18
MAIETVTEAQPKKSPHDLSWNDTELLKAYQTDNGRILPKKFTHLTSKEQRHVTNMIKRARNLLLLK